ncbi:Calmodulin and related proteins (EF-Hand superfamily) [Plasmopara halstedii]|uniref:Calmodulin and related proteins (EF-Hand superfamily) n=1 Tax=Plasmopara halstedii TaxID=4781 RepID=A0A0P1ABF3_PLAHL|nr:Calmodulin and related proteins (EF-Hand superfamily) [Plasmopara halstedii]CEG37758.1 Calmodulin and related proteins (EF-Hand superfamily) [Plasmopara halstedii]|eukprot:XP_024574127.1 Calmodulin and related proteins (EF-Hand superfamily) [Plasmopara halstedii]
MEMDGWEEFVDSDGQTYYYHEGQNLTQWNRPEPHNEIAKIFESSSAEQSLDDRIVRVFRRYDTDESGELSIDEFQLFYRALLGRESANISDAQVQQVFSILDASGDGLVTFEEFQLWWKTKLQIEENESIEAARIARVERRRDICRHFLKNADAIVIIVQNDTTEECFDSNLLPRLVALLGDFLLRGLAYRQALYDLVADPMQQLVSLDQFLAWYDHFESTEQEKLEIVRANLHAEAQLRMQHEAKAAAEEEQFRRKQMASNGLDVAITEYETEQQQDRKIAVLFNAFDADHSGLLNAGKLLSLIKALGHDMDIKQVTRLAKIIDTSGDGQINIEEFLAFWKTFKRGQPIMHQFQHHTVLESVSQVDANEVLTSIALKKRVYGFKRFDVTTIEIEVVDCIRSIINDLKLRITPLLKPDAAQRIQALGRGHLARKGVFRLVCSRYNMHVDTTTRLFYFTDIQTGNVLFTRPLYPTSTSAVAPFEKNDCFSKAHRSRYKHRPMLAYSAFYFYDVVSTVEQRLSCNIWTQLRSPKPDVVLLQLIARRRPRQLRQRSHDFAYLPLHYVVRHMPLQVALVRSFVDGYPQALSEYDAFKMTPLHVALRNQHSTINLVTLLARNPLTGRSIEIEKTSIWACQTINGDTPLHGVISYGTSFNVFQWALSVCAQEIQNLVPQLLNERGESAFHLFITHQQHLAGNFTSSELKRSMRLFFKLFDRTVLCTIPTKQGDLPLHLAIDGFYRYKLRVGKGFIAHQSLNEEKPLATGWLWLIKRLCLYYPAALLTPKRNRLLPVHLGIKYGIPEELVILMFELTADAVIKSRHIPSEEQEKWLLSATAIAATRTTLLHLVLMHQPKATKLLSLLLSRMPAACRLTSLVNGNLPIHVAAAAPGLHIEILHKLCTMYDKGCRTYNNKRYLPLHMVIVYNSKCVTKVQVLLRYCREMILAHPEEHSGLRALLMTANTKLPDYGILLTLLDATANNQMVVNQTMDQSQIVTPLYALSLRCCTPEITTKDVAKRCFNEYEKIDNDEAYFLALAKCNLRKQQDHPTIRWTFNSIVEQLKNKSSDQALIQRVLYVLNEKIRAMNQEDERVSNKKSKRKGYGMVVDTVTLNKDLMLVRTVHQLMFNFPLNPILQKLGHAVLKKLLPSPYIRAVYRAKIDPYFNLSLV